MLGMDRQRRSLKRRCEVLVGTYPNLESLQAYLAEKRMVKIIHCEENHVFPGTRGTGLSTLK